LGGGPPAFTQGFTCLVLLRITARYINTFDYRTVTFFGPSFQMVRLAFICASRRSIPRIPRRVYGLGSFPFARRDLGNRSFFLLLRVLRCFSSPGIPSIAYGFSYGYLSITSGGFPHSDIHGSMPACGSPWLFAACHVLRRLLVPRHPPYALYSLI
jgi:hypothetical protein